MRLGLRREPWLKVEELAASCGTEWKNGISKGREGKDSAQWEGKFLPLTKRQC